MTRPHTRFALAQARHNGRRRPDEALEVYRRLSELLEHAGSIRVKHTLGVAMAGPDVYDP